MSCWGAWARHRCVPWTCTSRMSRFRAHAAARALRPTHSCMPPSTLRYSPSRVCTLCTPVVLVCVCLLWLPWSNDLCGGCHAALFVFSPVPVVCAAAAFDVDATAATSRCLCLLTCRG